MPITTNVVSLNFVHGEVYSIYYVIKFVSDLRQVGCFLRVIRFPAPIKLIVYDKIEILLKVVLNTMTLICIYFTGRRRYISRTTSDSLNYGCGNYSNYTYSLPSNGYAGNYHVDI